MLTQILQNVRSTPIVPTTLGEMADDPSQYARRYGVTNEPFLRDKDSGFTLIEDFIQPYASDTLVHLDRILRY
jgi:hypothetical protein